MTTHTEPVVSRTQFLAHVRIQQPLLLADETAGLGGPIAIYFLADPRDVRAPRYVGQTSSPRRRHLQHIRAPRPWEPNPTEEFWWQTPPRLRELYQWIRDLYQRERLLPFLLVHLRVQTIADARVAERRAIADGMRRGLCLFNVEARRAVQGESRTLPLPFGE